MTSERSDSSGRLSLWFLIAFFALPVLALLFLAGVYEYNQHQPPTHPPALPIVRAPKHIGLPAAGLDYYEPSSYFTGCRDWSWLHVSCYRGSSVAADTTITAARTVLEADTSFVRAWRLGRFLRVWVSLDQLMRWTPYGGFSGYVPSRLRDLDNALAVLARRRIVVDLVLFVYSKTAHWENQFHPEALDGRHPVIRAHYLQALKLFLKHLDSDPVDAMTVKVIDLQTEPYYQLEQYFDSPSSLGTYTSCISGEGVDSVCVDEKIIHPWLEDMYKAARSVTRHFLYTESDTGRLLSTDTAQQAHWISMYPVNVYDIHLYDSTPWSHQRRWTSALRLPKPWFAGETGCDSGNAACTYNGSRAAPIDRWWLANLHRYRAQSVLIESHITLWTYPYGYRSQVLTTTGRVLECQTDPGLLACRNSRL